MTETEQHNILRKYRGNKGLPNLIPNILNEFPPHKVFWEICAGSGRISWAKKPAKINICIDINPDLINQTPSIYPAGTVEILGCASSWITELQPLGTDHLVYLDLPYLPYTRPNSPKIYKYEMSTEEHIQILRSLKQLHCRVAISHYDCSTYDNELKGWRKKVVKISYHGHTRAEAVYFNYQDPKMLHETKYTGSNKTARQNNKRMAARWVRRFKNLPPQVKQLILATVAAEKAFDISE